MRLGSALTLIEEAEQSRLKPDVLSFLALVPALGCSAEPNLRLAFALDQAEAILGDKPPDLPNALGLSLALAEALASEERLHGGSLQQLHKWRYKLAYQKLHCLTSSWPSPAERLQDPVLEKQNSLGAFFTAASLTDLWLGPTKQSWVDVPRINCRRALQDKGLMTYSTEPLAQHLPAWAAGTFSGSSWTFGSGDITDGALPALYVDHQRSSHAERQILLAIMRVALTTQSCKGDALELAQSIALLPLMTTRQYLQRSTMACCGWLMRQGLGPLTAGPLQKTLGSHTWSTWTLPDSERERRRD
eukprot:g30430.t1